jgi:DHA2 family multidrug resistance protein
MRGEATRHQAELNLSYTTIASPIAGQVGNRSVRVARPLVRLRLLTQRNFGVGVVVFVLVGYAFFGIIYILPQYLGQVQGYNAQQIGNVLAWTGLPQLVIIPFVPFLMRRWDPRWIGAIGLAIIAVSCFMNTTLSLDVGGDQLLLPNVLRAVGQALVLTPLSAIATGAIAPSDAGAASGLTNMMRNLGGAIGTATLGTILTKREQFHSNIIGQSVNLYREEVRDRITALTNYFMSHGVTDPAVAQHQAIVAIGRIVRRQSLILGFGDTFAVIGVALALGAVILLLAKRRTPADAAAGHAHAEG